MSLLGKLAHFALVDNHTKNFCGIPGQTRTTMPPTETKKKMDMILCIYKDGLMRDHKRKCDDMDDIVAEFAAQVEKNGVDKKQVATMSKRLRHVAGPRVTNEIELKLKALYAFNSFDSPSVSSSVSSSASASASASSSSSSSSALSVVAADSEVVCTGECTLEQRNKEGFANAIVVD